MNEFSNEVNSDSSENYSSHSWAGEISKKKIAFFNFKLNNFLLSIPAVKFGRMSKKQREKVEDEVRFHRAQMRAQSDAAPDSSVFDTQTPSSSDQLHHGGYNG